MSETASTNPPGQLPKARVIIEMQPDGTLIMESYTNGQRTREPLNRGFEMFEMREQLNLQARRIESEAERKREELKLADSRRHNRVWNYVAGNYGIGFANKTVNGVNSNKRNAKIDAGTKKPIKSASLDEMFDLLPE